MEFHGFKSRRRRFFVVKYQGLPGKNFQLEIDCAWVPVEKTAGWRPVCTIKTESLHEALKKMRSHGVRRLPVVNDDGGLEGILTFDDVIELLSEELTDLAKLVVSEQKPERMPRA